MDPLYLARSGCFVADTHGKPLREEKSKRLVRYWLLEMSRAWRARRCWSGCDQLPNLGRGNLQATTQSISQRRTHPTSKPAKRGKAAFIIIAGMTSFSNAAFAQYNESFQSWSATSGGTWQTKSLAGSPFNVPPNAVVEIAVRNINPTNAHSAGVRAVGSSLQRRFQIQEANGGGTDVFVMHVQANANSEIQHYAANTSNIDFVLLGYWNCGTYVENFDFFNVTAGAWTDANLSSFGVGAYEMAEIVITNQNGENPYSGGVRANGSSVNRRVTIQSSPNGFDSITMIVKADANSTIEAYAGHNLRIDFYVMGYWTAAPGDYVEKFVDLGSPTTDATWEDIDLTASGVGDSDVAEILFSNELATEENEIGVRTNGSSLARLMDVRQRDNFDGDFARMHVATDANAVFEFRHEDVSDAHNFYLMGYWNVGIQLDDHTSGQEEDAFHELGAETNAELFAFDFIPCAGGMTVTQLVFRISGVVGLVNGDWAGIELVTDTNADGRIGVGETTTVGGAGTVNTAAGTITFSTSFAVTAQTAYILRADFASLSLGDEVTISLAAADITATQGVSGSTSSVTHKEKVECYFERDATWTASSVDTWEVVDLSGAPYNVPANAIVEIAMESDATANDRFGGVREVGSALDRRFQIHKAEAGGVDVVVMHVQANANSQIESYGDTSSQPVFHLLGYWICGEYEELFTSFTAGASAAWTDKNLCSYGIGAGNVAEIVMTNDDPVNPRSAGVRTNGSSLQRRVTLNKAEVVIAGVETMTMFVEADTSASSTIEVYAQDDADIDFYLVGYWSRSPLVYTELFADVGSPAANDTWQDIDLTSFGVPDTAHVEFVLANEDVDNERWMGVRANGSSLDRDIQIREAEDGGADLARMHVATDATATIEFLHSNSASANSFYLVGSWSLCSGVSSYVITDLGAINSARSSLGLHINSTGKVAGFEEDSNGNPTAWWLNCGTFTGLGTLGGSYAEAHGINDTNRVVGWAQNASGKRRAFTYSGGTMTDLGVISARTDSEAQAVNSSSEVVGTVYNFGSPPSQRLGFIYLPVGAYSLSAGMNSLGTLGGVQSQAFDINDSGQVVGGSHNASGNWRPFRWQNGTMTNLGTLGGETVNSDHRAEAINSAGIVCGRSYTSGGAKRAFVWGGSMTDLGVLTGGTESWAFGINDNDVVVGTSNITGGAYNAFIWDGANGMRNLNSLIPGGSGWTLTRATDINNDGTIVGWGTNGSGNVRSFLLTPTCKADGGAAAEGVIASGSGVTDEEGIFDQVVLDPSGEVLAAIELVTAEQGLQIDYEVSEPASIGEPIGQTLSGFAEGKALVRLLKVESASLDSGSILTVSLHFTPEEIAELGASPSELQLHVLIPLDGGQLGWVPAGRNIGESAPSTIVGESGQFPNDDGLVEYWAVRDSGGEFAVGKAILEDEVLPPRPTPRGCGPAMLPFVLFGAVALTLLKKRR